MSGNPDPASVPVATYRLQLTPSFPFSEAARAVPYLAALGISHLYLSPIFAAVSGSQHGYDVVDHNRINPELGGVNGFYELQRAAHDHGLGIILDIVPNHVGIDHGANPWWRDVMRHGKNAVHAPYFDIDWEGQAYLPTSILVYPTLGRPFGESLEAGELTLALHEGEIVVRYFDHTFPVAPETYPLVIGLPPPGLETNDPSAPGRLAELLDSLGRGDQHDLTMRLSQLSDLLATEPNLREFVESQVREVNGTPGDPASWDRLERVLGAQRYRLAYWRVSAEEINYRRFFDINELAAIRVEYRPVFDEVHRTVGELVDRGMCDGVRVDHIDGLYDPQGYLEQLNERLGSPPNGDAPACERPIYIEKVLGWDEQLPAHWRTTGTTGYEVLARIDRVFIDPAGEQPLTAIYEEFTGRRQSFEDVAFATRRRIAERAFAGEINVLAAHLHRLAQSDRHTRDITLRAHRDAIAAFIACLPVYRTYLEDGHTREEDVAIVEDAASLALARDPNAGETAMRFLCEVILLRNVEDRPDERDRRLHFRRRLQQLSGPVMAKGVEDTAFYRYNRLLSLNEVGSNPGIFGASSAELHRWFGERAKDWPHALSATTTHDTKRSEDARARLHVLSEVAREWRREVRAWHRMNSRLSGWKSGPDPNIEYYYYQTLVAAWAGPPTPAFRERMRDHMIKAVREAKEFTSWTRVNEQYEARVLALVDGSLGPRVARRFTERVDRFSRRIATAALSNTLAMAALKVTLPGVPDFYQGSEGLLTTLTDPDNRREVTFDQRGWDEASARKAKLVRKLLCFRGEHHELFANGEYRPVEARGPLADHVFAFERRGGTDRVMVAVPRLVADLPQSDAGVEPSAWKDTMLAPENPPAGWSEVLTNRSLNGNSGLRLDDLFDGQSVALLQASR